MFILINLYPSQVIYMVNIGLYIQHTAGYHVHCVTVLSARLYITLVYLLLYFLNYRANPVFMLYFTIYYRYLQLIRQHVNQTAVSTLAAEHTITHTHTVQTTHII